MSSHMVVARKKKAQPFQDQHWIELIHRMSAGDQSALAEFYDQSSGLVFAMVIRILNDTGAAEEITLDTYHQVWRQAQNYDLERGKPLSWLIVIARNRAIDRLRSTRMTKQEQTSLEAAEPLLTLESTPEDAASATERQKIVRMALAQLKPEQRQLIEIAFFTGLTHQEISDKLQLPLGTVKTRIRAGMVKLRELLLQLLN